MTTDSAIEISPYASGPYRASTSLQTYVKSLDSAMPMNAMPALFAIKLIDFEIS